MVETKLAIAVAGEQQLAELVMELETGDLGAVVVEARLERGQALGVGVVAEEADDAAERGGDEEAVGGVGRRGEAERVEAVRGEGAARLLEVDLVGFDEFEAAAGQQAQVRLEAGEVHVGQLDHCLHFVEK